MTTATDRLRDEVLRLLDAERAFDARQQDKLEELADTAVGTGDATLEAQMALVEQAAKLQTELAAIAAAIEAARHARRAALAEYRRAEADALRAEAQDLRVEAAEAEEATTGLLAQVRERTGVDYVPGPRPEYTTGDIPLGRPLAYGLDAATPGFQVQRTRADELETEAGALEAHPIVENGVVTGASVDELVAAVWSDAERIGPTHHEVETWAPTAEARAQAPWLIEHGSRHLPSDAAAWRSQPKRYALVWRGGVIDETRSSVEVVCVPTARPPGPDSPARVTGNAHAVH